MENKNNINYTASKKISIIILIILFFLLINFLNNHKITELHTYKENGKTYKTITIEIN